MSKTTQVLISNIKWEGRKKDTSHLPKTFEVELEDNSSILENVTDVMMEKFDVRPWSFDWERVQDNNTITDSPLAEESLKS